MPIRFRCQHCNQLMGIARRKAGMTVSCPTCHAPLVVPRPEPDTHPALEAEAAPPAGEQPDPVFERSDFEDLLRNAAPPAAPLPFAIAEPPAQPLPPKVETVPPPSIGLILSPTLATCLTVTVILLLALAFGAGLFIGHYWRG